MFCQNCGCSLSDNINFCPKCGSKTENLSIQKEDKLFQHEDTSQAEMNRDVIIQYLYDVRSLEVARKKIHDNMESVKAYSNSLGISQSFQKPILDTESQIGDIAMCVILSLIAGSVVIGIGWFLSWLFDSDALLILGILVGIIAIIGGICYFAYSQHQENTNHDYQIIEYNNRIASDKKRVEQELLEKAQLEDALIDMKKEFQTAENLLEQAYSVNILPMQFRNIYAVYYLYDYLSTSFETLRDALLQCNLDEIKQKLNTVIEQQQEIILNQAIMISQMAELQAQNQEMLYHAAATEQNTALAAQYAQIAANNAEACAWIGVAQYIKD